METQDIIRIASTRHTCKSFDPTKKIAAAQIEALCTALRFAPSSVNIQPWHFFIAGSDKAKALIAQATQGGYVYNEAKVRNASHVMVLCARSEIDDGHLDAILSQEAHDGRFATPEAKEGQNASRRFYANLHRGVLKDSDIWMEKQVYLALGMLLQNAAHLGIDACPMEGFDQVALNDALGLDTRGLSSVVLVSLGYRSNEDFNASLPKSRLAADAVIEFL